jgi:peptidoglycan/LPS O-acetylase OafA/YrhL
MGIIRLLLAISVIIGHSGPIFGLQLVRGDVAVKLFYIISGFYMSLILNEKYVSQKHAYRLFISNRFLRLFPVYWAVLALSLMFSIVTLWRPANGLDGSALSMFINYFHSMGLGPFLFLIFSNLCLFFQDVVMLLGLNTGTGNLFFIADYHHSHPMVFEFLFVPQAWSIGVELLFYLLAPFVVRRNLITVFGCLVLSLIVRFVLIHKGLPDDPWSYRFFPAALAFFLLGAVSYRIYKKIQTMQLKPVVLNMAWAVAVCAIFLFSVVHFRFKAGLYYPLFCICLPFIFERSKRLKFDSYIGDLSYPVYLDHMLFLSVLLYFGFSAPAWLGLALAVASILGAAVLNGLVQKPIEAIRQRRVVRQSARIPKVEPQPSANQALQP